MDTYLALLQSHQGRDTVAGTASFACAFLTGATKGKLARDLGVISKQISSARLVLRFFDDLPMWMNTRNWGAKEKDLVSRVLSVFGSVSLHLCSTFEKVAWAADNAILSVIPKKYWTLSLSCLGLFLVSSIIKILRAIGLLRQKREELNNRRKQEYLEAPEKRLSQDPEFRKEMNSLADQEITEYMSLVKSVCSLIMCINWLPVKGFLWSGKLTPAKNAVFGLISSFIGAYMITKQNQQKIAAEQTTCNNNKSE